MIESLRRGGDGIWMNGRLLVVGFALFYFLVVSWRLLSNGRSDS